MSTFMYHMPTFLLFLLAIAVVALIVYLVYRLIRKGVQSGVERAIDSRERTRQASDE